MNTIIKIFVGILVLGVLGTFSWGVSYVVSDSENYEKLKFTFNKICILILVTVLVAMGLIQGIPSSIFYGVIFLSITIVAMVTKLVPNYEYNQMAFGSILLVILFSVFKNSTMDNTDSRSHIFIIAALFLIWYFLTYITISILYSTTELIDRNETIYPNLEL